MFNARSETIQEKSAFRHLIASHRCIVWVNGFYEWKKSGSTKQPYYVYLNKNTNNNDTEQQQREEGEEEEEEEPMAFAGLWDCWRKVEGDELYTYTILTADSSPRLSWLHDRMPVILRTEEDREIWLRGITSQGVRKPLHSVLGPYNGEDLEWRPVTRDMSKAGFQEERAYMKIEGGGQRRESGGEGEPTTIKRLFAMYTPSPSTAAKAAVRDDKGGASEEKEKMDSGTTTTKRVSLPPVSPPQQKKKKKNDNTQKSPNGQQANITSFFNVIKKKEPPL